MIQKLSKLELQIMETLWSRGESSIRDMQEAFPEDARPAYTTVQTTVYRPRGAEGTQACAQGRKRPSFCSHSFAAQRAEALHRRFAGAVRREIAVRYGAADRNRQPDARRCERSREDLSGNCAKEIRNRHEVDVMIADLLRPDRPTPN